LVVISILEAIGLFTVPIAINIAPWKIIWLDWTNYSCSIKSQSPTNTCPALKKILSMYYCNLSLFEIKPLEAQKTTTHVCLWNLPQSVCSVQGRGWWIGQYSSQVGLDSWNIADPPYAITSFDKYNKNKIWMVLSAGPDKIILKATFTVMYKIFLHNNF
jgi:hypothetical protein